MRAALVAALLLTAAPAAAGTWFVTGNEDNQWGGDTVAFSPREAFIKVWNARPPQFRKVNPANPNTPVWATPQNTVISDNRVCVERYSVVRVKPFSLMSWSARFVFQPSQC